jgi:hypothetical protein
VREVGVVLQWSLSSYGPRINFEYMILLQYGLCTLLCSLKCGFELVTLSRIYGAGTLCWMQRDSTNRETLGLRSRTRVPTLNAC